ncbi:MAG: hypothetical protein CM15mP70_06580 [Pelagibacteraceae bacterium]|nr:MAG: hypothetical protein CM15mP70_06580 [Pelagibacteraceae bacterium]
MTSYIQFPRYCLFLIPDKNFTDDFENFCDQNSIDNLLLDESIYGFHSTVKAPFYLSHLYSEDLLIEKFQNIDKKTISSLLSKAYLVNKLDRFKNTLVLRFHQNDNFDFMINNLMREFDLYRKTLNNSEIKKDIMRFDQLSKKELMYYQIWGYPFYFECSFHHITLPLHQKANQDYLNSIHEVKYEKLSLLRQNSINENFEEISSLS